MRVELLSYTPAPVLHIARCARVSRGSQTKPPEEEKAFVASLIAKGHWSVLEHAYATLLIEGISRACADQLLRHRHISATVESQRAVDISDHAPVCPPSIAADPAAVEEYARAWASWKQAYQRFLALGIPKEDARFIAPMGITVRLVVTANFRAWRELLQKRLAPEAQWEIRELAKEILAMLKPLAPEVFGDLG